MTSRWVGIVAAMMAACSSSPSPEDDAPAPILDGAYYSPEGESLWRAFHGHEYVTWSSDRSCNDASIEPPASCEGRGTFSLDAGRGTLTLTDARTGEVRVRKIRIDRAAAPDTLVSGVSPRSVSLVESPSELLRANVATEFSLVDSPEPTQLVDWKENVHICLMVMKLLVGSEQPGSTSLPRPPPMPPPIVATSSSCGGKKT